MPRPSAARRREEHPPHEGGAPLPAARTIWKVTDTACKLGDPVLTPRGHGTIIDVRATPSGKWIFGVELATGEVAYFTNEGLRALEP